MKWITFDLDGTLMQNPFVGHVFPDLERLISREVKSSDSVIAMLVKEHDRRMQFGQIVEAYDWDEIVADLLKEYGVDLQIDVEELVHKHCTDGKVYLLDEHVIGTLQALKRNGYQLAVVTNGYYKYQAPVLKKLAIYDYFDLIVTPERSGYAKPDARILDEVVRQGEIIAHVGDRLDHDIIMANEEGIQSVFINRKLPEAIGEKEIDSRLDAVGVEQFLKDKWHKETKLFNEPLPKLAMPKKIIKDTKELVELFS